MVKASWAENIRFLDKWFALLLMIQQTHQPNHLVGGAISHKLGWSRLSVRVDVIDLQQPVDWPPKRRSDACPAAALVVGVPLLELVFVVRGHLRRPGVMIMSNAANPIQLQQV